MGLTVNNYSNEKIFFQLFELQVEKTPNEIAVIYKDRNLTYKELNEKSNQLARKLSDEGVKPDSIIGIMSERTLETVIAIIAIFKSGGAYLPIDPNYPKERIQFVIDQSKIEILLVQNISTDALESKIKILDLECKDLYSNDGSNLENINNINNLAYVIYTSGSTGIPKGVMIEHAGMMNHIQAKINDLNINFDSIIAQSASLCFDISVWQLLAPLVVGGTTVIYPNSIVINLSGFINQLIDDKVTILEVVPSYLSAILDYLESKEIRLDKLRYLIVTGEILKSKLVGRWFELYPLIKMVNAYGPTEASDDITHFIMDRVPNSENIPIGKPINNLNIYIVDESMNLCPIGVKGEILVSGIGVGRGYLNSPDKTKEVFSDDPFLKIKGVRMYRTGDIGAWLLDGNIAFYGRKDYQVKVNGFRIELGEIEHELLKHPYVKEAVTVAFDGKNVNSYLCSYIVAQQNISIIELKDFLSKKLPEYMIPSYFVFIDKFPYTPNGKVDRKLLMPPDCMEDDLELTKVCNEQNDSVNDTIELRVKRIIKNKLDLDLPIEQITLESTMSDLGITSMTFIKIFVTIETEFGIEFADEDLDENRFPTLKDLVEYVLEKKNNVN